MAFLSIDTASTMSFSAASNSACSFSRIAVAVFSDSFCSARSAFKASIFVDNSALRPLRSATSDSS